MSKPKDDLIRFWDKVPRTIRDMIKASVDVAFVEILTQKIAEKERHDLWTCGGNENA